APPVTEETEEIVDTDDTNQNETNTSSNTTSNSKSSKPSIIQIPQLSIPNFGGLFVNPIEQTAQAGKNIGVFVPQYTIGFDGFLSAFIDSAQQLMAKELGVAGNAIQA
ncbi:MAG: hypothetical protein RQ756_04030, partial [Flavobacteriaceae bacterium]|nr:hypothetical protein [Flavobacteriaceae bacterium]